MLDDFITQLVTEIKPCRYDYVVQAVENLQIYMKTCSTEKNTKSLIDAAEYAIKKLQEIEQEIEDEQIHKPRKQPQYLSAALKEFTIAFGKTDLMRKQLEVFFRDNKPMIKEISQLNSNINMLRAIMVLGKRIEGRIKKPKRDTK